MALGVAHEAVIEKTDFHQVLSESTGLDIIVVGLGDTAQEVHGVGEAHVVLEGSEDVTLSHLAVGLLADQIKVGSVTRSERTAKWNEVIRIEEALGGGGLRRFRLPG